MVDFKQNGLVVFEREIGENDKLLVILTERYGKLSVISKGAKSLKNRHMASSQLFAYSNYRLRKRGSYYYILESDLIESYYSIRNDLFKLSLATYICDLVNDVAREGNCEDEILRLTLNTLYAIANSLKPLDFIKASYEIRLAAELGFMPDLEGCASCQSYSENNYLFDIIDGIILCNKCKAAREMSPESNSFTEMGVNKPIEILPLEVILAMRYVITCSQERFLSYTISDELLPSLYGICERYLLHHLERSFETLDFYKSLL